MRRKSKFNFTVMLLLFALVPLTLSIVVLNILLINTGSGEVKKEMHNALTSTVGQIGTTFDYNITTNEVVLKNYASAPIIKELLANPSDARLAEEAEAYTLEYFGKLEGWEGIYLADWNTTVLTHPAPSQIGRVLREGDRLEELRNNMLSADNGVYNVGIIDSPATEEIDLIISMYVPIFDGDTPIGYVGGGTYVNEIATHFSDVSELHLDSAYTYFVDKDGRMLFHPDPNKIGNPVENDAVKKVVAELAAGNHPATECVSYKYKGVQKYAAYYVGDEERFIAVVTADEKEVLAGIRSLKLVSLGISALIFIFFVAFVLYMAGVVTKPLKKITKALDDTAQGSLGADVNINSIVYETQVIIESTKTLQNALVDIIGKTKSISDEVNIGAEDVASLSGNSSSGAEQIVNAMEELANAASSMAENVQDINAQVVNMGDAVDNINEHTDALVTCSQNIQKGNAEADEYMIKVSESSEHSVEAVHGITKQIAETNEAIEKIGAAIELIISIASQTNLLSLNASIEAARAGESGRGFAVVADEIKLLAEQSNESANEVKKIVADIIEKSEKSVKLASEVANIISVEQGYISDTQKKFAVLSNEITKSLKEIQMIAGLTDDLTESKNVISNAITELGAIAEENAASNEEVTASINGVTESVHQIASNSESTKKMAEELKGTIAYFK